MDKEKIKIALFSALSLLESELRSVEFDELKNEYFDVIEKIELALKEIDKNE